ncbi:MAG: ATP-binding protein [Bacteroidota bacterium]
MNLELTCLHEVVLPSSPASISDVENLIEKTCAELNVSEDLFGNILISVTEGVNNAIIHGNKGLATLSVHLSVLNNDTFICFRIKDEGKGFDPDSIPDPTAPENLLKENGRGIFLMKSLSDDLVFENNGAVVNIYFRR